MKVIILEGVENSGKTNIGQALARKYGWVYVKFSDEMLEEDIEDIKNFEDAKVHSHFLFNLAILFKQLEKDNTVIIIDRLGASEVVYGKVIRNYSTLDYFRALSAEYIFLTRVKPLVLLFMKSYEKPEFLGEKAERIFQEYERYYRKFNKYTSMKIFYHHPSLEEIEKVVFEWLKK